ncbi:hypothetical protein C8R43DRAFT_337774 [Mycena crocata]|nr:hypothetical protein C8R43DRAFT_337774 [Mycena crocata]
METTVFTTLSYLTITSGTRLYTTATPITRTTFMTLAAPSPSISGTHAQEIALERYPLSPLLHQDIRLMRSDQEQLRWSGMVLAWWWRRFWPQWASAFSYAARGRIRRNPCKSSSFFPRRRFTEDSISYAPIRRFRSGYFEHAGTDLEVGEGMREVMDAPMLHVPVLEERALNGIVAAGAKEQMESCTASAVQRALPTTISGKAGAVSSHSNQVIQERVVVRQTVDMDDIDSGRSDRTHSRPPPDYATSCLSSYPEEVTHQNFFFGGGIIGFTGNVHTQMHTSSSFHFPH